MLYVVLGDPLFEHLRMSEICFFRAVIAFAKGHQSHAPQFAFRNVISSFMRYLLELFLASLHQHLLLQVELLLGLKGSTFLLRSLQLGIKGWDQIL